MRLPIVAASTAPAVRSRVTDGHRPGDALADVHRRIRPGAPRAASDRAQRRAARFIAPPLAREADREARVVARVAPPQAPRLARQAKEPFQAGALDPARAPA